MQQRWTAVAVVASIALALTANGSPAAADDDDWSGAGIAPEPVAAGRYVPVAPCRVVDTRAGHARRAAGSTLRVDLTSCTPPLDTLAAVVTVTAVDPAGAGYAVAYPAGQRRPDVSLLNWSEAGGAIANTGIIPTSPHGLDVYVRSAVHLVIDVSGYFVATPTAEVEAGRFIALSRPERVLDTRRIARPAPGSTLAVDVAVVPADATAVLVNVTATESTGPSYVTAWGGGARPLASFLNVDGPDQTRAATTISALNEGTFQLYSHAGDHLVVDVIGYFTGATAERSADGLFVPLTPSRRLDTRRIGPVYPGGAIEVPDVTGGVFVGNVTITETADAGYLRVLPARRGGSETSSVNADRRGATVANMVVSPATWAGLTVWSKHRADAVVDQTGYFIADRLEATHPPAVNPTPEGPSYPSDACAARDPRLDYRLGASPGAPKPREVRQIGTSWNGRPIWAEYYGPWVPDHTVVVVGAVHGDECGPALVVNAARRVGSTSTTVGYWVVPVLNPDGLDAFTRYNAKGADINRDGYRVEQPESKALMALTADVRPTLTVHVHSPYGFVGGYGPHWLSDRLAADIASVTGMMKARTAGSKPGAEFLWEGQLYVHSHALLLVELFPVFADEATVDRPRLPPRTVAEVEQDANQVIDVIHVALS